MLVRATRHRTQVAEHIREIASIAHLHLGGTVIPTERIQVYIVCSVKVSAMVAPGSHFERLFRMTKSPDWHLEAPPIRIQRQDRCWS
jgi:hypothetical protein